MAQRGLASSSIKLPLRSGLSDSGGRAKTSESRGHRAPAIPQNTTEASVAQFVRSFQALQVATRLYHKNHPLSYSALESAERLLRAAMSHVSPVAVGLDRDTLMYCPLKGADPVSLESKDAWIGVVENWTRCGVRSLLFLPETHLGELEAMACLMNDARSQGENQWAARLAEQRIFGIRVNVPLRQSQGTILATLVSVMMAHGGANPESLRDEAAPSPASFEDLAASLRLLGRFESIVSGAAQNNPQHTAETFHIALADAEPRTLNQLVRSMSLRAPRENEAGDKYLARLAESLLIETICAEFSAGRLPAPGLRGVFDSLGEALVQAMKPAEEGTVQESAGAATPGALVRAARALLPNLPKQETGAAEACVERLHETFWDELPARERSAVLRGPDAWCVPPRVISRGVEQLLNGGRGDAPVRESRIMLTNYSRGLEAERGRTRRAAANGLAEMLPLIERLWEDESPFEMDRASVRALTLEVSPGIAAILASLVENLARLACARNDFGEFERILRALEDSPRDDEHAHLAALAVRLMADTNWQLMVQKALAASPLQALRATAPLDPAVPRLLARDPERLLDRLGSTLAVAEGLNFLPAMTRLVRAAGEPVLGALVTHLTDPRRQRAATAIKLLAATEPQRLVAVLPRALPAWDWNLQDLAVAELTRRDMSLKPAGVARAFTVVLAEVHPLVAPVMLDEIGLAGEVSAVPLLCDIASGSLEPLRDVFIRIKAIEALGRLRAISAGPLLRTLLRQKQGLVHTEPAGLRSAAEDALAMIENHPSSARLRASDDALAKTNISFARPRRYLRIPLERPYAARIEPRMEVPVNRGMAAAAARVHSISMGGAFLESTRGLAVGDHIRVDIRAGLRHIHSTAVVRNVSASGGGVEFLHMPEESRERLRRLVRRLLA